MQSLILTIFFFLQIHFHFPVTDQSEKLYYYFCISRAKPQNIAPMIEYVLYTSVHEIRTDELTIQSGAYRWGSLVLSLCKNAAGCSSDLNTYSSYSEALFHLEQFKKRYENNGKYSMQEVDFKL